MMVEMMDDEKAVSLVGKKADVRDMTKVVCWAASMASRMVEQKALMRAAMMVASSAA